MGCADRYHAVRVAGVGDAEGRIAFVGAVLGLKVLIAEIAGSGCNDNSAVDQVLALVTDGSPAAGVVAHIMRDRQAEIRAVNRNEVMPLIDVPDVLQGRDNGEFRVLDAVRRGKNAKVV
jgi:hypothetical protein